EALFAGARERRYHAGFGIELADAIVPGVGQVDRAVRADRQMVHAVELCLEPGPTVAAAAFLSGASHDGQIAFRIDPEQALTGECGNLLVPGLVKSDSERPVEPALGSRPPAWGPPPGHQNEPIAASRSHHFQATENQADGQN